jgi:hypothetical protein
MFQRDEQGILDEYLQGLITESHFKSSARPWDHYDNDYRPMVEMAKEAGIPVIAANAPRRYVNRVTRLGRDSLLDLPPLARSFLPPLPYPRPSDAYRAEWMALMGDMSMEAQCPPPQAEGGAETGEEGERHGATGEVRESSDTTPDVHDRPQSPEAAQGPGHDPGFMRNGLDAQTLWDASMAYAISTFLDRNPGALVLHAVGSFHVKNRTGIPEQLEFYRPGTRTMVVVMELADDFTSFDAEKHGGLGDFVILTDKSLDLHYKRNCLGEAGGTN